MLTATAMTLMCDRSLEEQERIIASVRLELAQMAASPKFSGFNVRRT